MSKSDDLLAVINENNDDTDIILDDLERYYNSMRNSDDLTVQSVKSFDIPTNKIVVKINNEEYQITVIKR